MTGGRARLSSRVIGDSGCVYRAGDLGWVTQGKSTITPSSPTATEEYLHLCRGRHVPPPEKPYMCAQTLQPTPLHLLRAMRAVETPHHGSLKHVMSRVTSNLVSHAKSYLSSSLLVGESFSEL